MDPYFRPVSLEPANKKAPTSPEKKRKAKSPPVTPPHTPQRRPKGPAGSAASDENVVMNKATQTPTAKAKKEKVDHSQRQNITRIHNKWYDLTGFVHPGGPVAQSLAEGRDGTALFVAHHPFSDPKKMDAVLAKYEVSEDEVKSRNLTATILRDDDHGEDYQWTWSDPFEIELKKEVKQYFEKEAKRRGVSFFQATKATPKRWLEILALTCLFLATLPSLIAGETWTLVATPITCWVWMVNYWHDACHFALCRVWWINASLPYAGIWFSSPTTWYHQHVIGHHAYPNMDHKDPDLAHAPQMLREHCSVRWKPAHRAQHRWYRFTAVWAIAVGLGLHLAADTKLLLQHEYNRAVTKTPSYRKSSNVAWHVFGRMVYIFTTFVWPWLVFESYLQRLIFSTVPIVIFSLAFMINSQINHLTPDTAHAHESNYYRHQVATAQDFGDGGWFHNGYCFIMSGGLNFQIEHHLFPTVCHCHLSSIKPIVKRLCEKHGVPYHQRYGYSDALEEHFAHSHLMGEMKYERESDKLKTK